MSWLRSSPLRNSFSRQPSSIRTLDSTVNCDPKACYDSFCKHWQQAYDIIQKAQINRPPTHDDVLGVVSHLDHVITLLLLEVHHDSRLALSKDPSLSSLPANLWHSALSASDAPNSTQSLALEENTHNTPCLEHLLSENLLDKLYEWGTTTGRYGNAVKLEQLKLYELLVSHSRQHLLVHEPFVRPLLKLLASCQGEIFPRDVEARLVVLLNQLCVSLMQNVHLLDLFFFTPQDHGSTNFVIFSLLIPFVHREGPVGHQARDALLLCMALSKKNTNIGMYIAKHSNVCPVLATGLSGLYSLLPTSLDIQSSEWHRLTPDDVNDIPELSVFMNSLEFCNAVVQVAHPMIKQQLLDFLYQGFLVPVMGPALLQNGLEEQIAATAYFDLVLRSVTEPGLLKTLVRFLLDDNYDGTRLLDVLVQRIDSEDRLCLVSLALFESLIEINCEDIMLELIFRNLLTGEHLIIDCRYTNHLENANAQVDKFLSLSPSIVQTCSKITDNVNKSFSQHDSPISRSMPTNWNHYGLYSCGSLYRNYHAYLCDARQKINSCRKACESWANQYNTSQKHFEISSNLDNSAQSANGDSKFDTSQSSNTAESGHLYDVLREFIHEVSNLNMVDDEESFLFESVLNGSQEDESKKQLDSLQSLGDSSGYESFKYKPDECATVSDDSSKNIENSSDGHLTEEEKEAKANIMFSSGGDKDLVDQNCIGSFLAILFSKLQAMPSNSVYVNIHLTGLLSRLCVFPQDLLRTLLLSPHLQTKAPIRSLYQILLSVREFIDTSLSVQVIDAQQIAEQAREFLMERECRLVNARKNAIEAANQSRNALNNLAPGTTLFDARYRAVQSNNRTAFAAQYSSTNYDPFKRSEPKRKSISSSLSQMFRKTNLNAASSSLSSIYEFFTGFPNHQSNSSSSSANNETLGTPPDSVSYSSSTYWGNEANKNLLHESGNILFGQSPSNQTNITLYNLVMSAVILDEWVRELAAIVQEHNIEYLNKGLRCV